MPNERYQRIKEAVRAAQVAEDHGLQLQADGQGREKAVCPFHDDHDPSLKLFSDGGYKCFACDASGDAVSLEQHLGSHGSASEAASAIEERHHLTNASDGLATVSSIRQPRQPAPAPQAEAAPKKEAKKKPKEVSREEVARWTVRDASGVAQAIHIRHRVFYEDGSEGKAYSYRNADGSWEQGAIKTRELPLYLSEQVDGYDQAEQVLLVEGEKAADAAAKAGLPVVATTAGTNVVPDGEYLDVLHGLQVTLWPDADDAGRKHMAEMAEALQDIAAEVRWFSWEEAPEKGDAADHPAVTGGEGLDDLRQALRKAPAWVPPTPEKNGTGAATPKKAAKDDKAPAPTQDELRDDFLSGPDEYAYGLGSWRRYGKGIWPPIDDLEVEDAVCRVCEKAKAEKIKPTSSMVSSVTRLAKMRVYGRPEIWDAKEDLLVCANGTLEIDKRHYREHRQDDYVTHGVPYDYDPNADAPTFRRFMSERFAPEVADFLQEFAGYCLTTDVSHEVAVWLQGERGGGRSTFIAGLEAMLGEKAGSLGLSQIEKSQFALADVPGKTLLTATEQPASYASATYVLNALISGDKVSIERKHRDAYDFYPKAKILWAMNTLPRVPSPEDGLFRRVKVIEMPPAPKVKDPTVKEHIKEEGAGILNWALEGLERLRARGRFEIPERIEKSTAAFEHNNDVPALFVEACCVQGEELSEASGQLYEAYKRWCLKSGHKPQSITSMADEWERLGLTKYASAGKARWRGMSVSFEAREELGMEDV